MKKLLFIVFSLISTLVNSQDFNDVLFTRKGDSIQCKITLINNNWVYFDHKVKKSIVNEYIAIEELNCYVQNGAKTNITDSNAEGVINRPFPITDNYNEKTAGENLVEASKITYRSIILIVVGGAVVVAGTLITSPVLAIVGGVAVIGGGIHSIRAWAKISEAGKILKKHNL
ncbi:MAG: hypothetical protein WBM13_01705 [Bacteroidia bacterium]